MSRLFAILLGFTLPVTAQAQPLEPVSPAAEYVGAIPGERADDAPWSLLGDPAVEALVAESLAANGDLSAAVHRVEQADALALQALSPNLPMLSGSVGANAGPGRPLGQPDIPGFEWPDTVWNGSALLLANWSFDLGGQRILAHRAGVSDTVAAMHDRDQFAVSLGVQVTEAYLDAAAAAGQVEALERQLQLGRDLLKGIESRYETGSSTAAAVLQQRRQVEALAGSLGPLRTNLEVARSRLAVLLARAPGAAPPEPAAALPKLPPAPSTGRPADLANARPDLRAALARYTAATQRHASSATAFAPSIGVNAQGGLQWRRADDDDFETQENWGLGLSLTVPLFNAATIGGVRQARSAELAARDTVQQQILAAVGEVEQALVRRAQLADQFDAQRRQLEASRAAFDVARERYAAGLDDYLTLLTSWNSLLSDELSEINVRRSLLGADVRARAALGGGWTKNVRAAGE